MSKTATEEKTLTFKFAEREMAIFKYIGGVSDPKYKIYNGKPVKIHMIYDIEEDECPYYILFGKTDNDPKDWVSENELQKKLPTND